MHPDKDDRSLSQSELKDLLRSHSLRCTAARVAVLQCLSQAEAPSNAGEIVNALDAHRINRSTVFRALTDLSEAGLVLCLDIGGGARRFELAPETGGVHQAHPHFLCDECGRVYCLAASQVVLKNGPRGKALPGQATEVIIKGRCTRCQ